MTFLSGLTHSLLCANDHTCQHLQGLRTSASSWTAARIAASSPFLHLIDFEVTSTFFLDVLAYCHQLAAPALPVLAHVRGILDPAVAALHSHHPEERA